MCVSVRCIEVYVDRQVHGKFVLVFKIRQSGCIQRPSVFRISLRFGGGCCCNSQCLSCKWKRAQSGVWSVVCVLLCATVC